MVAIAESMGSLVTVVATVTTDIGAANQIGIKKEVLWTRALERVLEKRAPEKRLVLLSTFSFLKAKK
jgi:hypothetical protein